MCAVMVQGDGLQQQQLLWMCPFLFLDVISLTCHPPPLPTSPPPTVAPVPTFPKKHRTILLVVMERFDISCRVSMLPIVTI
jgi:hypothetical protein